VEEVAVVRVRGATAPVAAVAAVAAVAGIAAIAAVTTITAAVTATVATVVEGRSAAAGSNHRRKNYAIHRVFSIRLKAKLPAGSARAFMKMMRNAVPALSRIRKGLEPLIPGACADWTV
jgi:hypothetical protein